MTRKIPLTIAVLAFLVLGSYVHGQGIQPYPQAITDRVIHWETPMRVPTKGAVVVDPDFGSSMVRVTDPTTNFKLPGTAIRTEGSGRANEWSSDTRKFYVLGKGGQVFVFGFDPKTMGVSSLPNAGAGQGLLLPLRPGPSFSFVDPDLIYGTSKSDPLTITSYRFSTGKTSPVIDTRTCGLEPALGSGHSAVSDDDVSLSLDDRRVSITEGAASFGAHMFVVIYDRKLGCRWYNTQTGQIGGQWGATGLASVAAPFVIRHASLSRSGKYIVIQVDWFGLYVWDVATLSVTACPVDSGMDCAGYGALGYNAYVNGPSVHDGMQTVKRPLGNLSDITQLYYPLPVVGDWGQPQHFTWSNVDVHDSTPICASTHSYDGDTYIDQPFAGEILCIETDGLASTVWRFAHNRATYVDPYFHTQPLGGVSRDGGYFIFSSDWDSQLGLGSDGEPDSAAFIVKLD